MDFDEYIKQLEETDIDRSFINKLKSQFKSKKKGDEFSLGGDNVDSSTTVTSPTPTPQTITLAPNFGSPVPAGPNYTISPGFVKYLEEEGLWL